MQIYHGHVDYLQKLLEILCAIGFDIVPAYHYDHG